MTIPDLETGFAEINGARLYYELGGSGSPFVMIHAGIADHRQWNNEFTYYTQKFRVLRYDMRGFGRSEPVAGAYKSLDDLVGLMDQLDLKEPVIMMGCSMGGGLAFDMTVAYPERVRALIMVASEPDGLDLDVPIPDRFKDARKASEAGDLDLLLEIETEIWVDGERKPQDVNPQARLLAMEMNRIALEHELKQLGERQPNFQPDAVTRMDDVRVPVLVIVGDSDLAYMRAAADYMVDNLANARKVIMPDAAHLPNMEHPETFRVVVDDFLAALG